MARDHEDARFRIGPIGAVSLVALMLSVGCSVGIAPFGDGTAPPPLPTRRPALTTGPALSMPTQQPAASGPASPAPAATASLPTNVKTPSYAVFRKHLMRSFRNFEPLVKKLERRVEQRDVQGLANVLSEIGIWTSTELDWLQRNQPRDCYSEAHEAWSGAVAKWGEAFAVLEAALEQFDQPSIQRFVRLMEEGTATLKSHPNAAGPRVCAR